MTTETLRGSLRTNILKAILGSPPLRGGPSPGDTLDRTRQDTAAVLEPIHDTALVIGHMASVAVAIFVMVRISPAMTVVAVVPSLLAVVAAKMLGERIEAYSRSVREATGRVTGSDGELLEVVQAIQVAGTELEAVTHFDLLNDARRKASLKENILWAIQGLINSTTVIVATGALLIAAAQLMRAGSFTVDDFALFVTYVASGAVGALPNMIGGLMAKTKQARVSFDRLFELVPGEPRRGLFEQTALHLRGDIPGAPIAHKSDAHRLDRLELTGLSYHYPETGRGTEGVSLSLARGSFTVITGRIGAGKTTLLEVLLGLLPRDASEVRWNGEVVGNLGDFLVPPRCAYTPRCHGSSATPFGTTY